MIPRLLKCILMCGVWLVVVSPAAAQSLGTFRWQLTPFCNVVTLDVTQVGSQYRLEGFDDLCGAPNRAAVTGLVVPNPDGTLEFGLTIVTPSGPQHVDVTFSIASLGGPWRDNGGNTGTLVFNPASVSGPPRPGGLGALAINPSQVQVRVTGSCGAGQSVKSINADGTVVCGAEVGTINEITPGIGLFGGGTSGSVSLGVHFAGPGTSISAARSDHSHLVGTISTRNTGVGSSAYSTLATGTDNTAAGFAALGRNMAGNNNTAVGAWALWDSVASDNTAVGAEAAWHNHGHSNTVVGAHALGYPGEGNSAQNVVVGESAMKSAISAFSNVAIGQNAFASAIAGSSNVVIGRAALGAVLTGSNMNVAIGDTALGGLIGGSSNIAIGTNAGVILASGVNSHNIHIAHNGVQNDNGRIRIGTAGNQTSAFIAGIAGVAVANSATVLINTNTGQLGTAVSSARFKERIAAIDDARHVVQSLRPVTFFYKPEYDSEARERQFGLIAEEVEAVSPDLVVRDAEGQPQTVRYQLLAPFLIAEVQRLERERAGLSEAVAAQARELAQLRQELAALARR